MKPPKSSGPSGAGVAPKLDDPRGQGAGADQGQGLLRQSGDDGSGRAGRGDQPGPAEHFEARQAGGLRHRRQVRHLRHPLGGGDAERLHPASLDMRQRRCQAVEHQLHIAGDQVGHRRGAAAIGDVVQRDAGLLAEGLRRQVQRTARPAGGIVEPAGRCLGLGDQIGEGGEPRPRMHHGDQRRGEDQGDGDEVALHVVGQLRHDRRIDAERTGTRHAQGLAIGNGFGDQLHPRQGGTAATIVDDEGLAEALGKLLGDQPRHDVGGLTGWKGHDDPDRAAGPGGGGGLGLAAAKAGQEQWTGEQEASEHAPWSRNQAALAIPAVLPPRCQKTRKRDEPGQ